MSPGDISSNGNLLEIDRMNALDADEGDVDPGRLQGRYRFVDFLAVAANKQDVSQMFPLQRCREIVIPPLPTTSERPR